MAARAVLAGVADATPKSGKGEVEMIRHAQERQELGRYGPYPGCQQIKALVITAPAELRETLDDLTTSALIKRCRSFRQVVRGVLWQRAKYALRSLACRYRQLSKESPGLERPSFERLIQADGTSAGRSLWHRTRHGRRLYWSPPAATPIGFTLRLPSHRCAE